MRLLDLDEVPDVHAVGRLAVAAQVRERPDGDVAPEGGVDDHALANRHAGARRRVRRRAFGPITQRSPSRRQPRPIVVFG